MLGKSTLLMKLHPQPLKTQLTADRLLWGLKMASVLLEAFSKIYRVSGVRNIETQLKASASRGPEMPVKKNRLWATGTA